MRFKSRWRIVIVTTVLLLLCWIAFKALKPDDSALEWVLLKLFHPGPRHLELEASLDVAGQAVNITRTIECEPDFDRSDSSWFNLTPVWSPNRFLVSERLADGTGVMIVVPRACNRNLLPPSDFIPLVFWVDSADNPQLIEAYFNRRGLTDGSYHIRLLNFKLSRIDGAGGSSRPDTDFADWANLYSKDSSPPGPSKHFISLMAVEISSVDLPANIQAQFENLNPASSLVALATSQASSATGVIESIDRAAGGEYESAPNEDDYRRLIPLRPLPALGTYEVADLDAGPAFFIPEERSRCTASSKYCIQWHEYRLDLDHLPSHYIAAGKALLYQFRFGFALILRTQALPE